MVTHILWEAAGKPPGKGDIEGVCRVCGRRDTGLSFNRWVRPTFTDFDKLQPGTVICQACQFSFAECSELLARRVGKEKPQRMRNYSHFIVNSEWLPLGKGDKTQMADVLLNRDWQVAIIAQSGQKHIIFRAIPGRVQFEEQQVDFDRADYAALLANVEALYAGFSKSQIGSGNYAQHRVMRFGIAKWDRLERRVAPVRGASLFDLALFLAQRRDEDE